MEALAREAGMSKGGLFHHFPTKEALLKALVDQIAERVLAIVHQKVAADPRPGALLRGITTALMAGIPPYPEDLTAEELAALQITTEESLCALLSTVMTNPEVTGSLRRTLRGMAERLTAEPLGARQLQIWLSAEGLMFWGMMGVITKDDPLFPAAVAAIRESVKDLCAQLERESIQS
jgi:AcrR family transcriptional regulator